MSREQSVEPRASHAGAVTVRIVNGKREYLLVGPKAGNAEWLLPKGHTEPGESPEETAPREVLEEAGIRAAIVAPLGVQPIALETTKIQVAWFLAQHVSDETPRENRVRCWCPYLVARDKLTFEEARSALALAETAAAKLWPEPVPVNARYTQTLKSQLEYLNEQMRETSDTANQFLARFIFGGMIAVLALLNVDLILFNKLPKLEGLSIWIALGAAVLVFVASYCYFRTVEHHYTEHRLSHRKLKYKYELTLHALLSPSNTEMYSRMLEETVAPKRIETEPNEAKKGAKAKKGTSEPSFPDLIGFASMSDYLLRHHRVRYQALNDRGSGYVGIAMLLVAITFVIRVAALVITQSQTPQEPEPPPGSAAGLSAQKTEPNDGVSAKP